MHEFDLDKVNNLYKQKEYIAKQLTEFVDRAEEALLNNDNIEETLEYIGLKSEELLHKF